MDVKQLPCHMRIKASGIAAPHFSPAPASIARLMHEALIWVAGQGVRKDASGEREVTITIRTGPFTEGDAAKATAMLNGLKAEDSDVLSELFGDVPKFADMSPEDQALFMNAPPWTADPNWIQFKNYMASHSNYATAMPGEIKSLQSALMTRWHNERWTDNEGVVHLFGEHMIRDRRAG